MEISAYPPSRPRFCWHLRSRRMELGERTRLIAIVNLAQEDGLPAAASAKFAVAAAIEAVDGGADIVELGSSATRTGAQTITAKHECERLLPVLEGLLHARPKAVVSVDTCYAGTAREATRRGDSEGCLRPDLGRGDGRDRRAQRLRRGADVRPRP